MELEVIASLPEGARARLEAPLLLLDALGAMGPHVEVDRERGAGLLPVAGQHRQRLGETFFSAGYRAPCRPVASRTPVSTRLRSLFCARRCSA